MIQEKNTWSKKSTFIIAAAGSAIGLGNIWKFPYMVGENGGSAFVLVYLFFIFAIGLPVMMAECTIGKFSKKNVVEAFKMSSFSSGASKFWLIIPVLGLVVLFLILSFYSVIAGWAIDYTYMFAKGDFNSLKPDEVGSIFEDLLNSPKKLFIYTIIFMILTAVTIGMGVQKGLETILRLIMPVLFIILIGIVIYAAIFTDQFIPTFKYLFKFSPEKLTAEVAINAMGQAFFSLSLGMTAIIAYAAYMPKNTSITSSSVWVTSLDTILAVLAGFAIFPFVFSVGISPSQGPGLLFVSLSSVFVGSVTGQILGTAFFFLVFLAAISSSVSMVEPFVKWFTDKYGTSRISTSLIYCLVVTGFSLLTNFSFNHLSEHKPIGDKTIFDIIDFFASNILLPFGALLLALYVGWALKPDISRKELKSLPNIVFNIWLSIIRFIVPIAISIVFLAKVFGTEKIISWLGM